MATKPRKPRLRTLTGEKPHPSHNGWRNYLNKRTQLLERTEDGVELRVAVTSYYIVLPNGVILERYGFHGPGLFNLVKREGWQTVLDREVKVRKKA